jgi:hypothetical protein
MFVRNGCANLQLDLQAFVRRDRVRETFARASFFIADSCIALRWIMMKEHQLLRARGRRQLRRFIKRRMPPTDFRPAGPRSARIFFRRVLPVINKDVDLIGQLQELRIDDGVVLGIGRIDDALAAMLHAIRPHAIRMIAAAGADLGHRSVARIDLEDLPFKQIVERHLRAHVGEMNGKARMVHLTRERFFERARDVVAAIQVNRISGDERRIEERKALNVIPMHVAEEDVRGERHLLEKLLAQQPKAGAAVENQEQLAGAHFDAAGVASDFDGVGAGRRNAAAYSPERDPHVASRLSPSRFECERTQPRFVNRFAQSRPKYDANAKKVQCR